MSAKIRRHEGSRLIKRYGNRKLYDVEKSCYITLEGVRELVRAGEDVRVVDKATGEDFTGVTFAQIIYEEEKRRNGATSIPLLRWFIERRDEAVRDLMRSVERGREALGNVREATEKGMHRLVAKSGDRSRTIFEELLLAPQRQLDQLQQRIDAQVRQSVELFTKHPPFQKEMKRIERNIVELEKRLGTFGTGRGKEKSAPKRRGTGKSAAKTRKTRAKRKA